MATTLIVGGVITVIDGSTSAPSITNAGDTNSGIYFPADDNIGLVVGGSRKLLANSTGVTIENGTLSAKGGAVFNEDSADVDFRVESNDKTHMLFVDGGNDKVGIGTSAPVVPLSVRAAQEQLTLSEGDARGATFDYRSSTGNLNITTNGGNARSAPQLALHLNGVLSATAGVALGVGAANTASNVLDDYEEGTFAYTITGSTSGNLVLRSGYGRGSYVKIGNLVHVDIRFETTSDNSLSGNVYWSLPFTMANPNGSDADAATAPGYIRDQALGTDARTGVYLLSEGNAFVYLIFSREGAANSTTVIANNTNTDGVMEGTISITYRTT